MKASFNVTAKDIASGVRTHAHKCPVALAAKRVKVLKGRNVEVGCRSLMYKGDEFLGSNLNYPRTEFVKFPERIYQWISDYDCGREVRPVRFTMELTGIDAE